MEYRGQYKPCTPWSLEYNSAELTVEAVSQTIPSVFPVEVRTNCLTVTTHTYVWKCYKYHRLWISMMKIVSGDL